jgi:hypothetical protein
MKVEIGKRYRHYKGNEYSVLSIARLESDPEIECVVYRAEYDTPDFGYGQVWIRPLSMFEEEVEFEGKVVQRFSALE